MGKAEPIDGKRSKWLGLWWHPEVNAFSSEAIDLADLKRFKGTVRMYVRKNAFFKRGKNNRPNYHFSLVDVKTDKCRDLEWEVIADDKRERLYTKEEVRKIIHGVAYDIQCGCDVSDCLPEDYV